MAFLLLAMFYSIIDVRHWWTGTPFTYLGITHIHSQLAKCFEKIL